MTTPASRRPNILWISLEDTSPRFGCYGDSHARTPNIDRLAAEGMLYTHAFAVAGVCAPSRSAVITGMYPTSIGAQHMRTGHDNPLTPELPTPYETVPPPHAKAFTEYLRADGYFCTNNWKTDYQFSSPLTAWDEDGREAHWRHRESGQPFFAVFNHYETHESSMWGGDKAYESGAVAGAGRKADGIPGVKAAKAAEFASERGTSDGTTDSAAAHDSAMRPYDDASAAPRAPTGPDAAPPFDPDLLTLPPYLPDTPKSRQALATHYERIAEADAAVGELLRQLEEDGLADDTIVFLWSDHGEGLPRAKRWPYDAGIRVPLLVRWPGRIAAGRSCDRLVSLVDLAPTVLGLAGAAVPGHLEGRPFLGDAPEAEEPREFVFATRDRYDDSYDLVRAVRDERFKYIRNFYPNEPYLQWIPYSHRHPMLQELWRLRLEGSLEGDLGVLMKDSRPPEELYDCDADPHELRNLVGDPAYRSELEQLRSALDDWRREFDKWGDVPEERMAELMWPGGVQPRAATPLMIPINGELPGTAPAREGRYREKTAVLLYAATQGASIAYTTETGDSPRWKLYAGPIILTGGMVRIRAKAVRIGYRDSEEAVGVFTIDAAAPTTE